MRSIIYLEGRPSAHPLHRLLAIHVGGNPRYIDEKYRWQDIQLNKLLQLWAWVKNAFMLKSNVGYDVILVDNLHVSPVIMRKFGLIKKNQKLICHLGSHTLFFTFSGKYSKWVTYLHTYLFRSYDGLICEGKMAVDLARRIAPKQQIYYSFLGLEKEQLKYLNNIKLNFKSNNILFVGNVESDFRYEYKGIDLMLKGIKQYNNSNKDELKIDIIGTWSNDQIQKAKDILPNNITFLGHQKFYSKLDQYQIYLHCSRGDAFPTTSIEAMNAGLLTIVSRWTGTKEIVEEVNGSLVTDITANSISNALEYLTSKSTNEKEQLSKLFKTEARKYTLEKAKNQYQKIFDEL